MTSKEISVFFIGIMLVAFLYLMKHPISTQSDSFAISQTNSKIAIDTPPEQQAITFDPATNKTIMENILDIPAWKLDLNEIGERTSEELITTIKEAITQQNYFEPEKQNALFYLANLRSLDQENPAIEELTQLLNQQLIILTELAIEENNEKQLIAIISRTKALNENNPRIKTLKNKLASIKTINTLYDKGIKQIQSNLVVTDNSQDAWHTAKQCLNVDANNPKTQSLVAQINTILINNSLRAAEETDFQLANKHMQQAQLLAPESPSIINAQATINQLKQQRYIWLEQQINEAINQANVARAEKMQTQLFDLGLDNSQLSEYQNEISRIKIYGKFKPLDTFNDISNNQQILPTMVVMPMGNYTMGYSQGPKYENPVHNVTISYGFAVSQNEISVADFGKFIKASKHKTDAEVHHSSKIYDMRTGRLKIKNRINWQRNFIGKKSDEIDPVIHVSWNDAKAYTDWLSIQTGKKYRLLSEAEFEYILRAGSRSTYPWGNNKPLQVTENLTGKDDTSKHDSRIYWGKGFEDYNDGFWGPAPVGSFIPNQFKLNDTAGNVMEWVTDCWHDSYTRAPVDGSPWSNPGCENHVIRGGSWSGAKNEFRSSHRFKAKANFTDPRIGFRIALDL